MKDEMGEMPEMKESWECEGQAARAAVEWDGSQVEFRGQ